MSLEGRVWRLEDALGPHVTKAEVDRIVDDLILAAKECLDGEEFELLLAAIERGDKRGRGKRFPMPTSRADLTRTLGEDLLRVAAAVLPKEAVGRLAVASRAQLQLEGVA